MQNALIIEDEFRWQNILKELLEGEGYDVVIAHNYEIAREILERSDKSDQFFKIITLDLNLDITRNELEGMDLLESTNKHWHNYGTQVIIITGRGWDKEAQKSFVEFPQVLDFIPKYNDDQDPNRAVDFIEYFLSKVQELS